MIKAVELIATEFPYLLKKRYEQRVRQLIINLNLKFKLQTKQAPFIPWEVAFKISNTLWQDNELRRGHDSSALLKRKTSSVALMLATTSGQRWIDIMRLRWEDLMFFNTYTTRGVQASLRMSKNNLCNTTPQVATWSGKPNDSPTKSPVAALKRWWRYNGQPRSGYIFSYDNKSPEQVGASTIYYVQTYARMLRLPVPTKHSPRVSMCLTQYELGIDSSRIDRSLNWKTDRMQKHYLNVRDLRALSAPAQKLANLSELQIRKLQQNLR